jgi:hypothetical protein
VLSKVDLLTQYGDLGNIPHPPIRLLHVSVKMADFNLEFYTEVQDLSHLGNALSSASPRYAALNTLIWELIEDFSLVGFETIAVEVCTRIPNSHTPSHSLPRRTNTLCST